MRVDEEYFGSLIVLDFWVVGGFFCQSANALVDGLMDGWLNFPHLPHSKGRPELRGFQNARAHIHSGTLRHTWTVTLGDGGKPSPGSPPTC